MGVARRAALCGCRVGGRLGRVLDYGAEFLAIGSGRPGPRFGCCAGSLFRGARGEGRRGIGGLGLAEPGIR